MYDAKKARIEELRTRFDREVAARSPEARSVAEEYMEALTEFVRSFNEGPAADPHLLGLDTTGELSRTDDYVAWAEQERHRVRRELNNVA